MTEQFFFLAVEYCLFVGVSIKFNIYLPLEINSFLGYKAILIYYLSVKAAFVWNFIDIFIMIIGIGLTIHFKVLNHELELAKHEVEVKF